MTHSCHISKWGKTCEKGTFVKSKMQIRGQKKGQWKKKVKDVDFAMTSIKFTKRKVFFVCSNKGQNKG